MLRIKKEDLRLMYNTCRTLKKHGLVSEVSKEYGNAEYVLSMKLWKWGELDMQVSPLHNYTGDKKTTTVCGFKFNYKKTEDGGYFVTKEMREDEFERILYK